MNMNVNPISYQITGSGTPIVFIHGGFSDGPLTWGMQMVELARAFLLVVVDRRGHGKSPREPRPYTIAGDARDVMAIIDAEGITTFHVVGHSYGCLVAFELAYHRPGQVLSLHMVEPPYLSLLPADPDVTKLIDDGARILAAAPTLSADEFTARFFTTLMGSDAMKRLRTRPAWEILVREAEAEAFAEYPFNYPPERAKELRLDKPVRVYSGENSSLAMRKLAQATADAIPGASSVQIPNAGHDLQRTVEFNQKLLSVLPQPSSLNH